MAPRTAPAGCWRWSASVPGTVDSAPALAGGRLAFGDRGGNLYLFGTAAAQGTTPAPVWVQHLAGALVPDSNWNSAFVPTPVVADGVVSAAVWCTTVSPVFLSLAVVRCPLDGPTPTVLRVRDSELGGPELEPSFLDDMIRTPPVLGEPFFPTPRSRPPPCS